MKLVTGLVFAFFGVVGAATASDFRAESVDFAAPIVANRSSIPDLQFGSILYDYNTKTFAGLDPTGAWVTFGNSATATRSQIIVNTSN